MKLGLISDLHGDIGALERAWGHLAALGADQVVCAGDVVGYGPFPDRVVAFLREQQIPCVVGNHDRWAVARPLGAADPFGGGSPSASTINFLTLLPTHLRIGLEGKIIEVFHGSPRSDMEFVTREQHPPERLDHWLDDLRCDVLVVGHTHEPMVCSTGRGLVVNPGSVISTAKVETSRTFALLVLPALTVTFHAVETGSVIAVRPW
jgi:putative phosphoesterase